MVQIKIKSNQLQEKGLFPEDGRKNAQDSQIDSELFKGVTLTGVLKVRCHTGLIRAFAL